MDKGVRSTLPPPVTGSRQIVPGAPGGPLLPGQPPICMSIPRLATIAARMINTGGVAFSFVWICLNKCILGTPCCYRWLFCDGLLKF